MGIEEMWGFFFFRVDKPIHYGDYEIIETVIINWAVYIPHATEAWIKVNW